MLTMLNPLFSSRVNLLEEESNVINFLTLFILIDFTRHYDRISMELPIMCFKGLPVKFFIIIAFLQRIFFYLSKQCRIQT